MKSVYETLNDESYDMHISFYAHYGVSDTRLC
jgi:hypothetical protein